MISNEQRDYYAGGLLVLIGAGAAVVGSRYQIGSLTDMGPGFMPTALGIALAAIGILLVALNRRTLARGEPVPGLATHGIALASDVPDWRAWLCIIGAVVVFVVLAQHLGLAPAIFFCVLIGARGDRTASWLSSALLAAGVTIFGLIVFAWFLMVPIPIVRSW